MRSGKILGEIENADAFELHGTTFLPRIGNREHFGADFSALREKLP
jgi:hypothetical protein